ncbi:lipopolysaccharide biosynthesis protein [Sphingobacterium sp. UBA5670]|uniref:lipopolysaccharide biosynthesis protein n=1 Tax=Sphingobacterium sp. UBA5670 TaxID=1947502 RepID=UPI0025D6FB28|nr:lipopolysaccharide biosynthesis protein [Sphingobacterium sp. UBA5670]
MLLAGLIGGGVGFFYAKSKKNVYTATTTFVLEAGEKSGGMSQYESLASMVGLDNGGSNTGIFQGDNLLEFYKSRKMLQATLLKISPSDKNKLLIDRYLAVEEEKGKDDENIDFRKPYNGAQARKRDSLMNKVIGQILKKNLKVDKLDKKLSIIKVEITSFNESFAKEFNTALVQEVNDFYMQTKTKKAQYNIQLLQQQADSIRSIMNGNINTMASIVDATPNLNPTRQAQRIVPSQRSQFSAETNKAILNQLVQNLEITKMTLLKESPLIQLIDIPTFPLENKIVNKKLYFIIGFILCSILSALILTSIRFYKSAMSKTQIA